MIKRESYSLSIYPIYAVLLILSACGGLPTKPLIKVLQPQQPLPLVLAISEQVLRCDPQILMQEAPLSSKPRIHLITNAQRLKNLSKLEAVQVKIWLDWLESQDGLQIIRVEGEATPEQLKQSYLQMLSHLTKLGRNLRKPPAYIWWSKALTSPKRQLNKQTGADSYHSFNKVLPSPWLQLHKQQIKWLNRPSNRLLSKKQCKSVIKKIIHHSAKISNSEDTLQRYYDQNKKLGLRLVKGPRPKTTSGCLKLFGLSKLAQTQPELDAQGNGWHLILRPLSTENQGHHENYLTLPIPSSAYQVPVWQETDGVLSKLWQKRALWWGAQSCWQELKIRDIVSPLTKTGQRWVHEVETHLSHHKKQTIHFTPQSRWKVGSNTQVAFNSIYALAKETDFDLPLSHKGIVHSVLAKHQLVVQRLSRPRLIALWTGEVHKQNQPLISSFFLASLSPYILYEALLQLDEQQTVFQLAHEHKTISPSVLVLAPWQKRNAKRSTQWQALQKLIRRHHKQLMPNDLISTELSPINAGQLSGEASLFEGNPKAILKEQLKRYSLMLRSNKNLKLFNITSNQTISIWPFFEPYSLRLKQPLEHLP